MRVLGIAGSPRHNSNTEILLAQALKGAQNQGATTSILHVCGLKIVPCSHCDECLLSGLCIYHDDMQDVFRQMQLSDGVVLAAPLHFMGVPSQMKTLIDRAQSLWCRKHRLKQSPLDDERKRHGLFISVGGRTGEHLFEAAETTVKAFFASLGIEYCGKVAFSGVDGRAQITNNATALQEAYDAGQKLVQNLPARQIS